MKIFLFIGSFLYCLPTDLTAFNHLLLPFFFRDKHFCKVVAASETFGNIEELEPIILGL